MPRKRAVYVGNVIFCESVEDLRSWLAGRGRDLEQEIILNFTR